MIYFAAIIKVIEVRRIQLYISILLVMMSSGLFAMEKPVPETEKKTILFHLERNRDKNQVFYVLNIDEHGLINKTDPICAYWKKEDQPNKKIPLSSVQQKFGYGATVLNSSSSEVSFYLAAYPKGVFTVKRIDGEYVSLVQSGKKEVTMSKLFVHFKGTSFWNPVILKIDVYGFDAAHKEYLVCELIPE